MQVGKFSKINNCADWNKDVQAGIFLEINKLCSTIILETRVVHPDQDCIGGNVHIKLNYISISLIIKHQFPRNL